jgi:diguanylate cyclase (GGDEF)-like protein
MERKFGAGDAAEPEQPPAQLKLLHVEDDDGDAKILRRAFAQEFDQNSYRIQRVASLHEALRALRHSDFHAVLLDLGLNDASGLDGLNAIKEEHPDLPVVILSGYNDSDTALKAVRGGAQEYVVKAHSNSRMLALSVLSSIERKRYERHLFRLANHDALTGLPNRRMFLEYIRHWLLRAERWQRTEAIMFMDVNSFKTVNDTLGHDIGDELLIQIAARLKVGLRASDMLARYGGDEFIVHLDMGADVDRVTCAQVAEKISKIFAEPIQIGGNAIETGVSIGIALYPDNGHDTQELIQKADEAMYVAKRRREKFAFAGETVEAEDTQAMQGRD